MKSAKRYRLLSVLTGAAFLVVLVCILSHPVLLRIRRLTGTGPERIDGVKRKLSREILDQSLALGKRFFLANQRSEGDFVYQYDFLLHNSPAENNPVRQAGALWGLTLIHQDAPSKETADAVAKGLAFFDRLAAETPDGGKYTVYLGEDAGSTGTIALLALSLIDFLRVESHSDLQEKYRKDLDRYIHFLLSLHRDNNHFCESYNLNNGKGIDLNSAYSDGETLLALMEASKYMGHTELQTMLLASAEQMYKDYVADPLQASSDNDTTKAFYQWGTMAYYELYIAQWRGETEKYAQRIIDLAYWIIDSHRILARTKNTAYAFEGLTLAWEVARTIGNQAAMAKIGSAIDTGLYKLTSWQIGSPLENAFLAGRKITDPQALGGVMNAQADPMLRIDVTQHQMHAVILARRFIYKNQSPEISH